MVRSILEKIRIRHLSNHSVNKPSRKDQRDEYLPVKGNAEAISARHKLIQVTPMLQKMLIK
jgi:hypothetical protein